MFSKLIAFLKLARLTFLMGGFIFCGLGAAIAHYEGVSIDLKTYIWGQVIVTLSQLTVHFSNEYYDYEADILNAAPSYWSGGSRILIRGELPRQVAYTAAIFCLLTALILGSFLAIQKQDAFLLLLFVVVIGLSWGYSSPPLKFHSRTLGEFVGTFILAFYTPFVGYYLQAETLSQLFVLAIFPLLFLQFNMLLSVHVPDLEGDTKVGKNTLVVQLGRKTSAFVYQLLLVLAYLSLLLVVVLGLPQNTALVMLLPLPLALALFGYITRRGFENPLHWNLLTFSTITLLMSTATLAMISFIVT